MNETEGLGCGGHSNWTICTPLSPFCFGNFQFVSSLYWEANSYYPRGLIVRKGRFSNSKTEWDRGVIVRKASSPKCRNGRDKGIRLPWVLKLYHLKVFKPILPWQFSTCLTYLTAGRAPKHRLNFSTRVRQPDKCEDSLPLTPWPI